jgi:hypothetical protein
MKVPASFVKRSASDCPGMLHRSFFQVAVLVLASVASLSIVSSGWAQTATVGTIAGPIASVPSQGQVQDMKSADLKLKLHLRRLVENKRRGNYVEALACSPCS